MHVSLSLGISILRYKETKSWCSINARRKKIIYISHYTAAQDTSNEDIFFGNNLRSSSAFSLFLNHTRKLSHRVQNELETRKNIDLMVNTKALSFLQTLKLQLKQLKVSLTIAKGNFSGIALSLYERRLLIEGAVYQHSRPTISNLVLRERVHQLILFFDPEYLVMTLEGHAYENMLIQLRNQVAPWLKLVAYQHAPVVPDQVDFFRTIENLDEDDTLLVSGTHNFEQCTAESITCKTAIGGSTKCVKANSFTKPKSPLTILGAPEGTIGATREFSRLLSELSRELTNVRFVLRLHPALSRREVHAGLSTFFSQGNLLLSQQLLREDLVDSHIVIFRSSAVGIQALQYGALPFHFNEQKSSALNPLVSTTYADMAFSNVREFLSLYHRVDSSGLLANGVGQEAGEVFQSFFSPLLDFDSLLN
jgi:hypothetical protein